MQLQHTIVRYFKLYLLLLLTRYGALATEQKNLTLVAKTWRQ